jgi:hypothetical protein
MKWIEEYDSIKDLAEMRKQIRKDYTLPPAWSEDEDYLQIYAEWYHNRQSQLSEGGEEDIYDTVISMQDNDKTEKEKKLLSNIVYLTSLIDNAQNELQSLKQHNLKLTECLGELVEASKTIDYTGPESSFWQAITKAKSLIK